MTVMAEQAMSLDGGVAGVGAADITPPYGVPLSGFLLRRGAAATGVTDRLSVRALAIGAPPRTAVVLSYDALGLGRPALEHIMRALAARESLAGLRYALAATHTHSAPALLDMRGEPAPDRAYVAHVADATVAAVEAALTAQRPGALRTATVALDGLTRNRRGIGCDGRVRMGEGSGEVLTRDGVLDARLRVLLWEDAEQRPLAALAHVACHPIVHGGSAFSADVAGLVRSTVEDLLGAPCVFLQGASADINPVIAAGTPADLRTWGSRLRAAAAALPGALLPARATPAAFAAGTARLAYEPVDDVDALRRETVALDRLARGEQGEAELHAARAAVADVLNVPLDGSTSDDVAYAADVFARANDQALAWSADDACERGDQLELAVLRLGSSVIALVGAEVFAATAQRLQAAHHGTDVLVSGCAAPLVGYVPGDDAIGQGGYEVQYAWRYYARPRPWARGSEDLLVRAATDVIQAAFNSEHREPLEVR